jgi:hypothetical protein
LPEIGLVLVEGRLAGFSAEGVGEGEVDGEDGVPDTEGLSEEGSKEGEE